MRQMLKSYQAFLPILWERMIVYLIYPAALVLFYAWERVGLHIDAEACFIHCVGLIVTAELFLDYFIFGGVAAKDTNKLEYLKTSSQGLKVLKNSLVGDWIRRFVSVGVIIMAVYVLSDGLLPINKAVVCVFSTVLLIELGLLVERFVSLIVIVTGLSIFLGMFSMVITMSVITDDIMTWICPVLCIVVSVLGRMLIIRKMKGSYYDGGNKKGV